MNEVAEAERCLNDHFIEDPQKVYAQLVIRYLIEVKGESKEAAKEHTIEYLEKSIPDFDDYTRELWDNSLNKYASKDKFYKLCDRDSIYIYPDELDLINTLQDNQTEKLMFTLLCFAKYYNLRNEKNNNWVNAKFDTLFTMANLKSLSRSRKLALLHTLCERGLISRGYRIDSYNLRVEIIESESACPVGEVKSMFDLGYTYLGCKHLRHYEICVCCDSMYSKPITKNHLCPECTAKYGSEAKIKKCKDCGKLINITGKSNRVVRCEECQIKSTQNQWKNNSKKYRDKLKSS